MQRAIESDDCWLVVVLFCRYHVAVAYACTVYTTHVFHIKAEEPSHQCNISRAENRKLNLKSFQMLQLN